MSKEDKMLVVVLVVILSALLWLGYRGRGRERATAGHRLDQEQVR